MSAFFVAPVSYFGRSVRERGALYYMRWLAPKAVDVDARRQELILNILLFSSWVLAAICTAIVVFHALRAPVGDRGAPVWLMLAILGIFTGLLVLSRRGFVRLSASLFMALYFIPATYDLYHWGGNLPQGILIYALLIVMSGILLGTGFSLGTTVLTSITVIILLALQERGVIHIIDSWKQFPAGLVDGIPIAVTFFVIGIVAWLSNRELENSLHRAQASEIQLVRERDSLEVKVEERTTQLKQMQLEKMMQLYQFVEFGRLSSGFFHDLATPLTALSFQLESLTQAAEQPLMQTAQGTVQQAFQTAKKLEYFLQAVHKQLKHQETAILFSLNDEINQVFELMAYKARKLNVKLLLSEAVEPIMQFGNPFRFNQMILNLISNGIDSYEGIAESATTERVVIVHLKCEDGLVICAVQDYGCGIKPEHLNALTEPFFTTKPAEKGMGIGLSTSKDILEKEFQGTLSVASALHEGSCFTLQFPLRVDEREALYVAS